MRQTPGIALVVLSNIGGAALRRLSNGAVDRSRPIYPYPVLARYSGGGDPKQAASFGPYDPTRK